jgi:hypothetical protein
MKIIKLFQQQNKGLSWYDVSWIVSISERPRHDQ